MKHPKDKLRVRILVQDKGENAEQFAKRIEDYVLHEIYKFSPDAHLFAPLQFTSASDGRQTVNIQIVSPLKASEKIS